MNPVVHAKAAEIVAQNTGSGTHCILAQTDPEGFPTAAAVTAARAEGLRTLLFCTGLQSSKVLRTRRDARAGVCFASEDYNISLTGTMEIVTDPDIKRAAWYQGLEHHFSGPDDPGYCVLRFTSKGYNLLVDWIEGRGLF